MSFLEFFEISLMPSLVKNSPGFKEFIFRKIGFFFHRLDRVARRLCSVFRAGLRKISQKLEIEGANSMYGSGRIAEIITHLLTESCEDHIEDISVKKKVSALCEALDLSASELDNLILDNSPVLRTVKGHVFETYFDTLLRTNGYEVTEIGGDNAVDRVVNGFSLQLKTLSHTFGQKLTIVVGGLGVKCTLYSGSVVTLNLMATNRWWPCVLKVQRSYSPILWFCKYWLFIPKQYMNYGRMVKIRDQQ